MVDATGVGRPVVELIRDALDGLGVALTAVTFTAGEGREGSMGRREMRVSKVHFASRLKSLVQTNRVHLADTEEARQLAEELQSYELRVTKAANVITGAFKQGTHDDLVTALGLAVLDEGGLWGIQVGRGPWG